MIWKVPTRFCPRCRPILLADKAFDADERVVEPLLAAGKKLVIPPKSNRKLQRLYDKEMYKARRLMENSIASSNNTARSRPAMTRPPETSSPASIWPPPSFGSIEDRP